MAKGTWQGKMYMFDFFPRNSANPQAKGRKYSPYMLHVSFTFIIGEILTSFILKIFKRKNKLHNGSLI